MKTLHVSTETYLIRYDNIVMVNKIFIQNSRQILENGRSTAELTRIRDSLCVR